MLSRQATHRHQSSLYCMWAFTKPIRQVKVSIQALVHWQAVTAGEKTNLQRTMGRPCNVCTEWLEAVPGLRKKHNGYVASPLTGDGLPGRAWMEEDTTWVSPSILSGTVIELQFQVWMLDCWYCLIKTEDQLWWLIPLIPNTWEVEASESLWVQSQSGLQSKFHDSLGCYSEKPCLKETNKTKTKIKKRGGGKAKYGVVVSLFQHTEGKGKRILSSKVQRQPGLYIEFQDS